MGMVSMLIGLLVSFFIYSHAKKRGHSTVVSFLWAAASAVMPIVLVPLYFILGRSSKPQGGRPDDGVIDIEATVIEEETIDCPQCGRSIKDDFLVCPYCQTPLEEHNKHKKDH